MGICCTNATSCSGEISIACNAFHWIIVSFPYIAAI